MSFWEFAAATGGYAKAMRIDSDKTLSESEAAELADWIDEPPVWI